MNKYTLTAIIVVISVFLDQLTKYLVRLDIPLYSTIEVFPFFNLTHLRNSGVAFGMLQDMPQHFRLPFYIAVFAIALTVLAVIIRNTEEKHRSMIVGLSLILSGAIGNSIDRFRLGYVTDFLNFHWFNNPSLNWPPFNIADSCITVGAILVIATGLFKKD